MPASSTSTGGGGAGTSSTTGSGGAASTSTTGGSSSAVLNDPGAPAATAGDPHPALTPTFYRDLVPLLQKHCQSCHSPGRIAPFSLVTLDDAQAVAGLMAVHTQDRTMPPWEARASEDCAPRLGWKDDISLSDAEIAVFAGWSATGAQAGDPADAPPPNIPPADGDELDAVDQTVAPQKPFVVGGDGDAFRCFVLDPQLTQDRILRGLRIVAGNPQLIHHVLIVADGKGVSGSKADADGGYTCFSDPEVGSQYLASWTPGSGKTQFPPDAGFPLKAGTKLVMQIHYHPAGAPAVADVTQVQLDYAEQAPTYLARLVGVGNFVTFHLDGSGLLPGPDDFGPPVFTIPAGTHGHTETMKFIVPPAGPGEPLPTMSIYSVKPHMHYVGQGIEVAVHRPAPSGGEPADECLAAAPRWDFAWQRSYTYDAPLAALPTLHTGDEISVRCTYDNTVDNKALVAALLKAHLPGPVDVHYGNEALDEMCFAAITLFYKASGSP
jgi:hypothetical protein